MTTIDLTTADALSIAAQFVADLSDPYLRRGRLTYAGYVRFADAHTVTLDAGEVSRTMGNGTVRRVHQTETISIRATGEGRGRAWLLSTPDLAGAYEA